MSDSRSIMGTIDKVKEALKLTSDDNTYPDEYIYGVLLDFRNEILYREFSKKKKISKFLYKTICMPLVKSNQIPCDCVPEHLGCVVLRSKYKIPRPIKSDLYELITVTTLDGRIRVSPTGNNIW